MEGRGLDDQVGHVKFESIRPHPLRNIVFGHKQARPSDIQTDGLTSNALKLTKTNITQTCVGS